MKEKKQDRYLREMFRSNLENAEVTPGHDVFNKIVRKLTVKEFLHFQPFRFNIYYLGGIVAAAVTAITLFNVGRPGEKNGSGSPESLLNHKPDSIEILNHEPDKMTLIVADEKLPGQQAVGNEQVSIKKKNTVRKVKTGKGDVPDRPGTAGINEPLKSRELFSSSRGGSSDLIERRPDAGSLIVLSAISGCAPLKVQFGNNLKQAGSIDWSFGDGGTSDQDQPVWIYDVEGVYLVTLKVLSPDGITESDSAVITVFPRPAARFEINPDKSRMPADELRFQNYSTGAVKYLWDFGDASGSDLFEPVHRYAAYGKYNVTLRVYSEDGCSDSLVVHDAFSGSAYFIEFPNAFIPNESGPSGGVYSTISDESAQVFHPSSAGVSEYHLKIFSKFGVLIFESNDIYLGWDGYYKGQLSNPGVYIWKVRGNFINGEPFTRMGDVTLLKNQAQ